MILRNKLNGYTYAAVLTAEHACSSYGQLVLVHVSTGEAIDQMSAIVSELVEATPEERAALLAAGYALAG